MEKIEMTVEQSGEFWGSVTINENRIVESAHNLEDLQDKMRTHIRDFENIEVGEFVIIPMLDVKQLRIGNLVFYKNEMLPIDTLHGDNTLRLIQGGKSIGCFGPSWIKGVRLTLEILQQFGFKHDDLSFHHITYEKEPLAVNFEKSIDLEPDEVTVFLEDRELECNYLHQLQNLFFVLTGKELEVKL